MVGLHLFKAFAVVNGVTLHHASAGGSLQLTTQLTAQQLSSSAHLHTLRVSRSPLAPLTHRRWADEPGDETRILFTVVKLA